jgi:hypothetical protein
VLAAGGDRIGSYYSAANPNLTVTGYLTDFGCRSKLAHILVANTKTVEQRHQPAAFKFLLALLRAQAAAVHYGVIIKITARIYRYCARRRWYKSYG